MGTILRVTELEVVGDPDAVVRTHEEDVTVVIDAKTEPIEVEGPDNRRIEWSGDLGLNPDIGPSAGTDDGRLITRFALGAHTVTATGLAGGSSVTVRVWRSEIEVVNGPDFVITDEPQMPVITARLRIIGPVTVTVNEWRCRVRFSTADTPFCPNAPFGVISDDLEVTQEGGEQFTPIFDKVRGGTILFGVSFTIGGEVTDEFTTVRILGTNPQQSEIQAALPHDTLRRIACRESEQRQFDAGSSRWGW
jgi:hypothetical protein